MKYLYLIVPAIILFLVFAIFVIPAIVYMCMQTKADKKEFEELKQNGQITSIRYKVKKIIYWTECATTYAYDTYVRTLGDNQIIHTTNKMEDDFKIPTAIIKIELCDLKTVRLMCMSETGEIFKQSISNKNASHLQLTFENGKTTVLF